MTDKVLMSLLVNTAVFSVLFCVMLLLRKTIGKKISPVLVLVMWFAVVMKLVIPFGFESSFSIMPPQSITGSANEYTQAVNDVPDVYAETDNVIPVDYTINAPIQPEQNTYTEENTASNRHASAINTDWSVIALGIWAAGAVTVGAALCLSAVNLRRRIKHARTETPQYILELAEQCKKELGLRRNVSIIVQSAIDKPLIMGAVRPVLVLPEDSGRFGREALRHVLLHELTHLKGGDLWAIKFMNILRGLYWFNPLMWICFKLIREDIELACDQKVIKTLGQRHRLSYIETVLSFARRKATDNLVAAMGLFDGRPSMERRIKGMYGKTKTGINGRITAGLFAVLILAVSALTACQPAATGNAEQPARAEDRWEYNKDYELGRSLNVDAAVYSLDAENLPTLTVVPRMFESGDQIRAITKLFCPNAKIYDPGDNVNIQFPIVPGSLKEENYQLVTVDDSMQANMIAESSDSLGYITFANWDNKFAKQDSNKGSCFLYDSEMFNYDNDETHDKLVTPESLKGDSGFQQAKEKADGYVKDMGIDYMSLNSVSRGDGSYSFYYTRTYNGLPETYVPTHTGTMVTVVDGAPPVFLWEAEYLCIVIQDGSVVKASWQNPSEIKSIDNGKSKTLPWEEIRQIFLNELDDMMTQSLEIAAETNSYVFPEETEVVVNRVELGYTKLLTKGTNDDYKLVPTWMFMGYEKNEAYHYLHETMNMGADTCFVTINAIDGTVIDRGQGL